MIGHFPEIYPDELIYSLLARFYVKSGYLCYWYAAEDLFQSKTIRPDIEFVNAYTPAALQRITRNLSMEDMVLKHTMFPYYGRFLPLERKQRAYQAFMNCEGNYHNLLAIPKRKEKNIRHLRYCPMCADADRKKHGETYWHRIHQMQGVYICPIHKCYLADTDLVISGKTSPDLVAAEAVVPMDADAILCENEIECELTEYIMTVFQSDVDLQSDVLAGDFLHSRMSGTKYLSVRGEQRNIALFHTDFTEYFKIFVQNEFTEIWQIQKVFANDRIRLPEICMIAMFLDIPAADLVYMELPEQTQEQSFDELIFTLHEQGLKYPEIARRLNAPYDTVKAIGEQRYKAYHKEPKKPLKCGAKSYNWQQIDKDTLPFVKDAIKRLQGNRISRPKKVTVFAVEQILGLPSKRISLYLPLCRAEIEKNYESQEQYWAREVVWAVRKIIRDGDALNWKHVRNYTNMRKCDLIACMPCLCEFANDNMIQMVQSII